MGFRFSRRIKILPGVRLNVSKSGVSTSFGTKGAWLTVGKRGTRKTVGLPGTGISYTKTTANNGTSQSTGDAPRGGSSIWLLLVALLIVVGLIRACA